MTRIITGAAFAPAWQTSAAISKASPTFEEFLYRYWIENLIWFESEEGDGNLTPEQHAYCDHYRTSPEVFPE